MNYTDYKKEKERECVGVCKIREHDTHQRVEKQVNPIDEVKKVKRPKRNILDIKKDLLSNLKEFLDDLSETLPQEEDLLIMRIFLFEQVPIDLLINQINKYVMPHRDKIKNRDEKFFMNEDGIFGKIEGKKILHFKDIWNSNRLEPDNKNTIFIWFEQIINIMDELNSNN